MQTKSDQWSQWLLSRRHGGDEAYRQRMLEVVQQYRDRVLDGARLEPSQTLIDVGAGDGMVGFGAIDRTGPSLKVILTDISPSLLAHMRQSAVERGIAEQCQFIEGSADQLTGVIGASADVVTTRAVLVYVADKARAFSEFFRVLKRGGRISLCEPIYQDDAFEACALTAMVQSQPNHPDIEFLKLVQRYRAAQFPATQAEVMRNPITNYNERDLLRLARQAGFASIHMELHVDIKPALPISWEAYLDIANHPWAPTLRQTMDREFSADQRALFERRLRPIMESGQSEQKQLNAFLTAIKPPV